MINGTTSILNHKFSKYDKTSSIYLYVKLKALASWIFLSFTSFWRNSDWYEYKNKSARRGAQFVPIGMPTTCWNSVLRKDTNSLNQDLSTLYTTLPHDRLKTRLKETIHKVFSHRNYGPKCVVRLQFHRIFVRWIDNSFVEQVDDPAMYVSVYGVLWRLGIQYK
jgi:hypothetical protein